jgi:tol-pal system protein YbgF
MRVLFPALSLATALALATQAPAQQAAPAALDKRVGKLEAEMRAVQRKVFPGGSSRYFEPEITAPEAAPAAPEGVPASNPLTDLSQRVGEMERQLRTMTGQAEANEFKLRQLEAAFEKLRGDHEFRLNALEGNPLPPAPATPAGSVTPVAPPTPAGVTPVAPAPLAAPAPAPAPAPAAAAASAPKAATAAEAWQDAYSQVISKKWPAAERAMTAYLADWPRSTRIPQAQYWLGRSFAERNMHAQAADAYLKVYNNHPRSDRAPDALIGLANALIGIKNPGQACRVLGELNSVYGDKLSAGQKTEAQGLRTRAKCS